MSFKISPISPDKVLELSNGEVRIDETISFKSKLPVRDGLFCQKIFGPIKDYTCECGKYEGKKYTGHVCENCGVSVISSKSRSERMGHISLHLPIVNPMAQTAISSILDIKPVTLDLYLRGKYCCFFVDNDNSSNLVLKNGKKGRLVSVKLDDPRLATAPETYNAGSIALYNIVKEIDLEKTMEVNDSKYLKIYKEKEFDLTNLFLSHLPVSPPNYRALIDMDNYYSTDPKNDLYLRICRRSIRLKRVIELNARKEIICYENNLIYKAVNNLFFGGSMDGKGNPLPGILEGLSGKTGLIRKNILGKRVDYSGRSAITSSGDTLEMDQIGLPVKMAYELFKPFIISEIHANYAETYKEAIAIYKQKSYIALKSMEKVVRGRRVLMNRAPTLHRYGIMSFRVKLVDGETIFVHPLICVPFNADFDGDQVGIHVPISDDALRESDELLAPQHNLLASLDGKSQLNPTHEMVIGLDLMTRIIPSDRHKDTVFNSMNTLEYLYSFNGLNNTRSLNINEEINWKYPGKAPHKTCYGRLILEQLLETRQLPERFTKSTIKSLISKSYDHFAPEKLLKILHELMKLSLHYVTVSGFSIASKDCVVPSTKKVKVDTASKASTLIWDSFRDGIITQERRFEDNVRLWDTLVKDLQDDWKKEVSDDNSVNMMLTTGARVGMTQVSQLNVAKGLMTDPSNRIIEDPIINSLVEGLTTYDYFKSCRGSRKSMADKMKLTPDSGYLTRRMVTVSRDFFIVQEDCGTTDGIYKEARNAVGRFSCDGELVKDNPINNDLIKVRTPIFCKAEKGLCVKCYGVNPATRKLVTIGSNIGTVAAQSLTESTTQMTMKTFHTSGAAVVNDSPLIVRSAISGEVTVKHDGSFDKITVANDEKELIYIVDNTKSRLSLNIETGKTINSGDRIAVYTHEGLENDDVSGSLPKIEALYEASIPPHSKKSIIAPYRGEIRLENSIVNNNIIIYINEQLIDIASSVPVFVATGETVEMGQTLTYGSPNISDFYETTKDLAVTYNIFEDSILKICEKENLNPNPIHLEVIFRCMSNLVLMENDSYGLRSHGDAGEIKVLGIKQIGRVMPSWLKAIGYGHTKEILKASCTELRTTYDLSSERLMHGGLIFDNKKVIRTE